MTLQEWLDNRVELCTHVLVVRNGKEPVLEAVTHISQDQIDEMKYIWTRQYYEEQDRKSAEIRLDKLEASARGGKTKKARSGK
jgi:hypothetical protein